jgi:diguanylate cyclase (GGDEF)-like protein/PAS domain S-box-containing protein
MEIIKNLWGKLTTPAERLKDIEERANSKLLSSLLLIFFPVGVFVSTIPYLFGSERALSDDLDFIITAGSSLFFLIAYGLNRSGYFKEAVLFAIFISFVVIFTEVVLDTDLEDLAYLLLPLLILNVFFPLKHVLFALALNLTSILLLPVLFPKFVFEDVISSSAAFMSFGGLLLIISKVHLTNLEKRRKKQIETSELRYSLIAQSANDGLWDWDIKTNTVYYSPRWREMLGYEDDEIGNSPLDWINLIHPDDLERATQYLSNFIDNQDATFEFEYRLRHKNGQYIWILTRGKAVLDESGTPIRTVGSHSDISLRKKAEAKLQHDALHDALTGLPNRMLLLDRLQHALHFSERDKNYQYAVLFLDLDKFKDINDSLGHDVGDQILIECAQRIKSCARSVDTVARLGGDEFIILLENFDSSNSPVTIAERIFKELLRPSGILNIEIPMTASIGIVFGNSAYSTPNIILKDADIAMYQAKNAGRARYAIFDSEMGKKVAERIKRERELAQAIQNNDFKLSFQPIVDLSTGEMLGMEALVRWHHAEEGIIQPNEFIPVAEETGLILEIGNWVLEEACKQVKDWEKDHPRVKNLSISVNISGKQITHHEFFDFLVQTLQETKLDPKRLHLEITESTIVEDAEQALKALKRISKLGVQLHLDDFGTGYSSIGYLHRFPISALKIDKTFIDRIAHDGKGRALVEGIIHLAAVLDLNVVAEGIELIEQLTMLKELNCALGQGFYAAKPMYKEDMELLFKKEDFFLV